MISFFKNFFNETAKNLKPWAKYPIGLPITILCLVLLPVGITMVFIVWVLGTAERKVLESKLVARLKSVIFVGGSSQP